MSNNLLKFYISHIVCVATFLILLLTIIKMKNKKLLHHICSINVLLILLWIITRIIVDIYKYNPYELFHTISTCFTLILPSTMLYLSILLINNQIKKIKSYIIIFLPSLIFLILYLIITMNYYIRLIVNR